VNRSGADTSLRGARILVTGAAGGIGVQTCAALRRAGAHVIAADLAGAQGVPGADDVLALDVTDDEGVLQAVSSVAPLDGIVLSHGVTSLGPAVDTPMSAVDRVLAVNLRGAIAVTQAALPGLIARRGRIAVLSSVSGFAPLVHRTAYAASKHGVHGYFESLRLELAEAGVSVTIVAPSFVATGIESRAAYRAQGPDGDWSTTGELLSPQEVAHALVAGMAARRALVLPSRTARAAWVVNRVSPGLYGRAMRRRILGPGGSGGARGAAG
jgi:NAD(P)-dependent dehydrogenase (short-subunit alcohol dehydrogenase family)